MARHRAEDKAKEKNARLESEKQAEIARRSRVANITIGKRPKLTKFITDELPSVKSRPMHPR